MNKNLFLNLSELSILLLLIYLLKFIIRDHLNLKYLLRFGFCILLFLGFRIGFNVYNYEKKEVLVHSFYKDKIISIKNKGNVDFWINENRDEKKMIDFVIDPYLISRRADECDVNYYPEDAGAFVFEGNKFILKDHNDQTQ